MPSRPKVVPHFETEQEELEFWDTHHPADYIEGPVEVILRAKKRPKKTVTLRMDQRLYDNLRAVAHHHDVPYQRLMQELLRDALEPHVASLRKQTSLPDHSKRTVRTATIAQAAPAATP
jgi:predicted DNA binding CopG/RHH family protein